MEAVLAEGFSIGFAAAVLVLAASFFAAAGGRLDRRTATALGGAVGIGAVAAWLAVAWEPGLTVAVAAAGLTACALATVPAYALSRLVVRGRRIDADYAEAESRLSALLDREAAARAAELERTLALARADSAALLADQERRLAEERRASIAAHEAKSHDELSAKLAGAQRQVERRFAEWAQDLERIEDRLAKQIEKVGARQLELIAQVEARVAADAERIVAESDEQRVAVARLRGELGRSIQEAADSAAAELEAQAADRRRALHEVAERLRRREEALTEQIEREETEAARRIAAGFAEVERKQLDSLQRVIDRATAGYSEIATQQFSEAIKNAQEDAARRLARELERAVASFEREATGVLSDRLAQISDSGTQRLEKRLGQIAAGLERQREDAVRALETRLAEVEEDIRRSLQALVADVGSERTVVEARLQELSRKVEEAYARAR
jgi:hypothetical protein